jgi:hypothetical protein
MSPLMSPLSCVRRVRCVNCVKGCANHGKWNNECHFWITRLAAKDGSQGARKEFSALQKNFLLFQRNCSDKALIPFIGVRIISDLEMNKKQFFNIEYFIY